MNSTHAFYDDPARSPGAQQRQASRQAQPFEAYGRGAMGGGAYFREEQDSFDAGRGGLDRLNTGIGNGASYNPYDPIAAQTWNPGAFASNGFGTGGLSASSRTSRPMQPGRRNLPTGWMDGPMGMPPTNNFSNMGPPSLNTNGLRSHDVYVPDDDELIPTAIVIKNIPFAVRKEELVEVMTSMNLPLPYAFNYHFDQGVFRGLAFANFTSAEETAIVIEALNSYELNGRKLRVEYKKMLPVQERERIEREKRERRGQLEEQHRPMATPSLHNPPSMSSLNSSRMAAASPSPIDQRLRPGMGSSMPMDSNTTAAVDLNDPQTLQFYNEILLFKGDASREMLVFPSSLSAVHRRTVHTIAHMMSLSHQSTGSGEQRQVYVSKGPVPGNNVSPPLSQSAMLQPDANRRTLNRAATTDFSEARGQQEQTLFNAGLRGQHSTGFLGLPESPGGFGNSSNLRTAKSFADLRSFTPSPAPSTASYPNPGPGNHMHRMGDGTSGTPTLTPTGSNNPLLPQGQQQRSDDILNGFGSMTLNPGSLGPAGSPRRMRGVFAMDRDQISQGNPSPAPIGSNRAFSSNSFPDDGNSRLPGSQLPIRQPRGPAPERAPGFARRQNGQGMGHQQRGSDELNQRAQQGGGRPGDNPDITLDH